MPLHRPAAEFIGGALKLAADQFLLLDRRTKNPWPNSSVLRYKPFGFQTIKQLLHGCVL